MKLNSDAWIGLICLVVLIAAINIPLFFAVVNRKSLRIPFIHNANFKNITQTIRRPWHEEDDQLDELAQRVKELQEKKED